MRKKFHFKDIYKVMRSKNTYIFQKGPEIKTVWTLAMDTIQMKYELCWNESIKTRILKLKF